MTDPGCTPVPALCAAAAQHVRGVALPGLLDVLQDPAVRPDERRAHVALYAAQTQALLTRTLAAVRCSATRDVSAGAAVAPLSQRLAAVAARTRSAQLAKPASRVVTQTAHAVHRVAAPPELATSASGRALCEHARAVAAAEAEAPVHNPRLGGVPRAVAGANAAADRAFGAAMLQSSMAAYLARSAPLMRAAGFISLDGDTPCAGGRTAICLPGRLVATLVGGGAGDARQWRVANIQWIARARSADGSMARLLPEDPGFVMHEVNAALCTRGVLQGFLALRASWSGVQLQCAATVGAELAGAATSVVAHCNADAAAAVPYVKLVTRGNASVVLQLNQRCQVLSSSESATGARTEPVEWAPSPSASPTAPFIVDVAGLVSSHHGA